MQPNWSKLAALGRTLVILFASTFVGALVLPVAADGTLPMTWASWRPVLAVALSASVIAEIVWIRSHLAQTATALGLPTAAPSAVAKAAAPLAIVASLPLLLGALVGCGWWNSGGNHLVESQIGKASACVLYEVLVKQVSDPAVVTAACSPATIGDVLADVESVIAYYTNPPPAPPGASPMPPPTPPPGLLEHLQALEDRCKVLIAAGGGAS